MTARPPHGRPRVALLHRLRPSVLGRAVARRLAVRRVRTLARAGHDAPAIARRTGLAEDLVRLVLARG